MLEREKAGATKKEEERGMSGLHLPFPSRPPPARPRAGTPVNCACRPWACSGRVGVLGGGKGGWGANAGGPLAKTGGVPPGRRGE